MLVRGGSSRRFIERPAVRRWWGVIPAVVALLAVGLSAPAGTAAASPSRPPATPWPGGIWQPDPVTYGMTVVSGVPITMDDGVILFANIGYPTDPATGLRAAGNFPVLLTQNPYVGPTQQPDPFFVTRGYIFASVTVRGTLNSEAPGGGPLINDMFSPREAKDGVELVNWAAHELDGSNGVVGLTGCSQLGDNQLFTAAAVGPHSPVKAILPACAGSTYDGVYFSGGIPGPIVGLFGAPSPPIEGTQHRRRTPLLPSRSSRRSSPAGLAHTTTFTGSSGPPRPPWPHRSFATASQPCCGPDGMPLTTSDLWPCTRPSKIPGSAGRRMRR